MTTELCCDVPGCTATVRYECRCRRCGHEPDAVERFHACAEHPAEAGAQHVLVRERPASWIAMREEVAWHTVEQLMLKSFTGGGLTEAEQRTVQDAYTADATGYGERHTRIVRDEVARRRRDGA